MEKKLTKSKFPEFSMFVTSTKTNLKKESLLKGHVKGKYFQPITSTLPKITATTEIDLTFS
jgi:hypothetical protein